MLGEVVPLMGIGLMDIVVKHASQKIYDYIP